MTTSSKMTHLTDFEDITGNVYNFFLKKFIIFSCHGNQHEYEADLITYLCKNFQLAYHKDFCAFSSNTHQDCKIC